MSFLNSLKISASGLASQRTRMNAISSNLANVNTTRTPEGGPYRRKDAVFETTDVSEIFGDVFQDKVNKNFQGVKVSEISEDPRAIKLEYNPTHPDANEEGYVQLPNVNLLEEMVNMMSASRSRLIWTR